MSYVCLHETHARVKLGQTGLTELIEISTIPRVWSLIYCHQFLSRFAGETFVYKDTFDFARENVTHNATISLANIDTCNIVVSKLQVYTMTVIVRY